MIKNGLDDMKVEIDGTLLGLKNKIWYKIIPTNWSGVGLVICKDGSNTQWYDSWSLLQTGEGNNDPEKGNFHPLLFVTEATFESYNPNARNDVIQNMGNNLLYTIPPRNTARKRHELGRVSMSLSNKIAQTTAVQKLKEENDVRCIYEIVKEGTIHLKVPKIKPVDHVDPRLSFEQYRRKKDLDNWPLKPILPDPSKLSKEFQNMWCVSSQLKLKKPKYKYEWTIVGPMWLAYLDSDKTRNGFERKIGNYTCGHPSYARATWYRRVFSTQVARMTAKKNNKILIPRMKQTDARRETRHLFHLFKITNICNSLEKGNQDPEKGKPLPSPL